MGLIGNKEYFKKIKDIKYEGKDSDNPFAFKYYNPDQIVAGKSMRDHFKFAVAYWHSFCGDGSDPSATLLKYFLGMSLMILFKLQKIKLMLLLNSLPKWDLDIFVFMIMTL